MKSCCTRDKWLDCRQKIIISWCRLASRRRTEARRSWSLENTAGCVTSAAVRQLKGDSEWAACCPTWLQVFSLSLSLFASRSVWYCGYIQATPVATSAPGKLTRPHLCRVCSEFRVSRVRAFSRNVFASHASLPPRTISYLPTNENQRFTTFSFTLSRHRRIM